LPAGQSAAEDDRARIDNPGKLSGLESRLYVEAYHKTSYMRFDFGDVGSPRSPADRQLREIDGGASALFRVKVVDESGEHGRILAEADHLSPLDGNQANANRISLLPVETADLRDAVWQLDFSNDRPVLVLNRKIENVSAIAHGDDHFFTLVYPAVVQRILFQILWVDEHYEVDGDTDDWRCQWLKFVCQLPGVNEPPKPASDEERDSIREQCLEWIDRAVAGFCEKLQVRDRFVRAHTPRE
jgi:hypothetical protein